MKYPAYPDYKSSGVDWLDEVPEHWDVQKLKYVARILTGGTPSKADETNYSDGGLMWVKPDDLQELVPIAATKEHLSEAGQRIRQRLPPGTPLVCCIGSVGKFGFAEVSVATNQQINGVAFSPRSMGARFGLYVIAATKEEHRRWANVNVVAILNAAAQGRIRVPSPPFEEQHDIATFLDRETAKIDALIAKKRELIEKLDEKRSALISQVVTRGLPPDAARAAGLDPNPPLKFSGIDWLGDTPAHWETPPLYTRYSVELGKMLDEARITGEHSVRYLRNIDVQWDRVDLEDLPEMDIHPPEMGRYTVTPGDLLVCEGGEPGRSAIVPPGVGILGYQKAVHRLRPKSPAEVPRYLFYTLRFTANLGVFEALGNQSTISHLTGESLRRYRFPKPPFVEQAAIADYLDARLSAEGRLVAVIEAALHSLLEYRSALITAAVTGQIDVRGNRATEV